VRGSVAKRAVSVVDTDVECPSLSPDGKRLVFKYRLPDLTWQLWVLDLATLQRTQLTEPDNVDDQAAWLDDNTVTYAKLDENTGRLSLWSVPADGTGAPTKLADDAESPAALPGP
jgi:Tol biopolymer transport system component